MHALQYRSSVPCMEMVLPFIFTSGEDAWPDCEIPDEPPPRPPRPLRAYTSDYPDHSLEYWRQYSLR